MSQHRKGINKILYMAYVYVDTINVSFTNLFENVSGTIRQYIATETVFH